VDNPHKALSLSPTHTHTNAQIKKRNDDWSNNGIDVSLVARVLLFLFFFVFSELDDEPSKRHREETMCDVIVFPTVRLQKLLQERSTTERRRRSGIFARRVRRVEQRVVF
jgi:hypothetical protein